MPQVKKHITLNILLLTTCFIWGCNNHSHKNITKAFYYWKTNFTLTAFEQKKLDSFGCKTLYIRLFDIDWDAATNAPKPVAVSNAGQPLQQGFTYVPVIFITQDALNKTPASQVANLVANFTKLVYQKSIQLKLNPAEIQVDCDWTNNNKDKYFLLLTECKKQAFFKGKTLSCTIRLHQLKYPLAAGLPPVHKGLLMCYNMGNLRLAGNNNSILDEAVAEKYLNALHSYPLKLDVALPLFSWCLLYDNENRFTGILRDAQENDLLHSSLFTPRGKNLYTVTNDTLYKGYNLRKNETIRYEDCKAGELYTLAAFVGDKINNPSFTLIFYHCDSTVLSKYTNDELEKIYHLLH